MRVLILGLWLFVSSCSLILPYEEEVLCSRGEEGGYCGRISDVYKKTLEEDGDAVLDSYSLCLVAPELCR